MTSTRRSLWNRSPLDRQDQERPQGSSGHRSGCHLHTCGWRDHGRQRYPQCLKHTGRRELVPVQSPVERLMCCLKLRENEDSIIWLLPERYALNHCGVWRTANVLSNLAMRMSWSAVSNAADMSRSRRETWPTSSATLMSDTTLRAAVSVEWCGRYTDCLGE